MVIIVRHCVCASTRNVLGSYIMHTFITILFNGPGNGWTAGKKRKKTHKITAHMKVKIVNELNDWRHLLSFRSQQKNVIVIHVGSDKSFLLSSSLKASDEQPLADNSLE